jgi:hypothetical protein
MNYLIKIIKNATEAKKLGCDWPNEIIEVADSLYHQQVPKSWCYLSGGNVIFPFYPLASYLTDVLARFQQIERCLTMVCFYLLDFLVKFICFIKLIMETRAEKKIPITILERFIFHLASCQF